MYLESVKSDRVRNLRSINVKLNPHINFIFGENGSGKTSFLESISILSNGNSFRTRDIKKVIHNESEGLVVSGIVRNETLERTFPLGIQRQRSGETLVSIDSERQSKLSSLSKSLPTLSIDSNSIEFIEGSPGFRRSTLDWGLFHVEHSYLGFIQSYRKALHQKASLLKNFSSRHKVTLRHWNSVLAEFGESINQMRSNYISNISPYLNNIFLERFKLDDQVTLEYRPGWNRSKHTELLSCLSAYEEQEIIRKGSLVGPHRCDIAVKFNGIDAKDICSRGQKKLVLYGVRLAQVEYMKARVGECPVLLFDDLPSELDTNNQKRIIDFLSGFNCQVCITAINRGDIEALIPQQEDQSSMFHVEHGTIKTLS